MYCVLCMLDMHSICRTICVVYISINTILNQDKELRLPAAIDNLQLIQEKIVPTENERFKDTSGKPIKRYE